MSRRRSGAFSVGAVTTIALIVVLLASAGVGSATRASETSGIATYDEDSSEATHGSTSNPTSTSAWLDGYEITLGLAGATVLAPGGGGFTLGWEIVKVGLGDKPSIVPLSLRSVSQTDSKSPDEISATLASTDIELSHSLIPTSGPGLIDQLVISNLGSTGQVVYPVLELSALEGKLSPLSLLPLMTDRGVAGAITLSSSDYGIAGSGFSVSWLEYSSLMAGGLILTSSAREHGFAVFDPISLAHGDIQLLSLDILLNKEPNAGFSAAGASSGGGPEYAAQTNHPPPTDSGYLEFTETGLPSGDSWSAKYNLSGVWMTESSEGSTIEFTSVPVGTYQFVVTPPSGYLASPSKGEATIVEGETTTIPVTIAPPSGTPPSVSSSLVSYDDPAIGYTGSGITSALVGLELSISMKLTSMGTTPAGATQTSDTVFYNVDNSAGTVVVSGSQNATSTGTYTFTWTPSQSQIGQTGSYSIVTGATDSCSQGCGTSDNPALTVSFFEPAVADLTTTYEVGQGTPVFTSALSFEADGQAEFTHESVGDILNVALGTGFSWRTSSVTYKGATVWPGGGGMSDMNQTFTNYLEYSPSYTGLGSLDLYLYFWLEEGSSSNSQTATYLSNEIESILEFVGEEALFGVLLDPPTGGSCDACPSISQNAVAPSSTVVFLDPNGSTQNLFGLNVYNSTFLNGKNAVDFLWAGQYIVSAACYLNNGDMFSYGPITMTFGMWVEATT